MKKSRTFLVSATIILLALLVVFPALSWLYLQRGMDFRKEILNDLADLGTIVEFEIDYEVALPFTPSVYPDKLVLASFFDPTNESDKQLMGELLVKLHEQFDERSDLLLVNNLRTGNELILNDFLTTHQLADPDQIYFNLIPPSRWESYLTAYCQIGKDRYAEYANQPFFLLIDLGGRVKRIYRAADKEEIKRMVAQTAMILPVRKERELIFERESEK